MADTASFSHEWGGSQLSQPLFLALKPILSVSVGNTFIEIVLAKSFSLLERNA